MEFYCGLCTSRDKCTHYNMTCKKCLIVRRIDTNNIALLISQIESQFEPGMTWDNYGEWHISNGNKPTWIKLN